MVSNNSSDAIRERLKVFDKWKILIPNQADRKDFESDLLGMTIIYYNVGYKEGKDYEVKEQERTKIASILPLEKKNS